MGDGKSNSISNGESDIGKLMVNKQLKQLWHLQRSRILHSQRNTGLPNVHKIDKSIKFCISVYRHRPS